MAPAPARPHGTPAPTARTREAVPTPHSLRWGSYATMEKVLRRGSALSPGATARTPGGRRLAAGTSSASSRRGVLMVAGLVASGPGTATPYHREGQRDNVVRREKLT